MTPTLRTAILDALMEEWRQSMTHDWPSTSESLQREYLSSRLDMILPIAEPMIREAALREAPEIAAAEIRGLEMAKDYVLSVVDDYRFDQGWFSDKHGANSIEQFGAGKAALALEKVSHRIARIAELKAKTEPTK